MKTESLIGLRRGRNGRIHTSWVRLRSILLAILAILVSQSLTSAGEYWVSATGNDMNNDGKSSDNPKATVQAILDTYTLTGGDVIRVEAGLYSLTNNIVITVADSGSPTGGVVLILGAGTGTVFDGNGSYGFQLDDAQFVHVSNLVCSNANVAVHLENNCSNVELSGLELHHGAQGVVLSGGGNHYIHDCNIHHNSAEGVLGSSSYAPWLAGNQIHESVGNGNSRYGISLSGCYFAQIIGNTITNIGNDGITVSDGEAPSVLNNTVARVGGNGVSVSGCSGAEVGDNTLYLNGTGLYCVDSDSLDVHGNYLYSNAGDGATVQGGGLTAKNNLAYANGGNGLYAVDVGGATIENNTFYHNSYGLTLWSDEWGNNDYAHIRNNIYDADGPTQTCFRVADLGGTWFSDYNDFHATGHAFVWDWEGTRYTLASWQKYSGRDYHSLDVDPLFVNPAGPDGLLGGDNGADDDFHLQSTVGSWYGGTWTNDLNTSLCIDAGDPTSDYSLEPTATNNCRINLGFEGDTPQASRSPARRLQVLFPNGGEINFRRIRVRWAAVGCWTNGDQVKVQYSCNGTNESSWHDCLNANPLAWTNTTYGWDVSDVSPCSFSTNTLGCLYETNFLIRVKDLGTGDTSISAGFTILDPGPKTVYVNDDSTVGDEWCAAPGSFANAGLSNSCPLDSFQAVVDRYPEIGAGDQILLDNGSFDHGRTIYLDRTSSGLSDAKLVIRGTDTNFGAALFDRADTTYDTVWLQNMDDVRVLNLHMTGGRNGLNIQGDSDDLSKGMEVVGCELYTNAVNGLSMSYCTNANVTSDLAHDNGQTGISVNYATLLVASNVCYGNSNGGLNAGTVTGAITANQCYNNRGWGGIRISQLLGDVTDNECHNNSYDGLMVSDGSGSVNSNRCYNNGIGGLSVGGTFSVLTNDCHHNNGYWGLDTDVSGPVKGNVVHENTGGGLHASGSSGAVGNQVYLNGATGLQLDEGTAQYNVVYGNGGDGVHVGGSPATIQNNLIYSNSTSGTGYYNINVPSCQYCSVLVENNTLDDGNGLYLDLGGSFQTATVRNNIIWARGDGQYAFWVDNPPLGPSILTSDYNDLYATDGATPGYWLGPRTTLHRWQSVTLRDLHSLSLDPLFVSTTNSPNFHLRSTYGSYKGPPFNASGCGTFTSDANFSFCIDGGDPASPFANECPTNGCRVDLGAFGNTADASQSPTSWVVQVTKPDGGEKWFRTDTITWLARGPCTDTATLSYSTSASGPWVPITTTSAAAGMWPWDTSIIGSSAPGGYWVQVCVNGTCAVSSNSFTILDPGPRSFYVNDASTSNDVYCTAACAAGNDGLSSSNPMCSVQRVIDAYPLAGDDIVYVDTGNYPLLATVIVTTNDVGYADAYSNKHPITFIGSTDAAGSVLSFSNITNDGFYVQAAPYIRLENLKVTGADNGIRVNSSGGFLVAGIEVLGCEVCTNSGVGILLASCTDAIVSGNLAHDNVDTGISVNHASLISSNVCYNNLGSCEGCGGLGLWADTVDGPIAANLCYSNGGGFHSGAGISVWQALGTVVSNECHDNAGDGFDIATVSSNFVGNLSYNNDGAGIWVGQVLGDVTDNECHDNGSGFGVDSGSGSVSSNRCYNNWGGLSVIGAFRVQTNDCHHNNLSQWDSGLSAWGGAHVEGNVVHENTGRGIDVRSSSEAVGNQVFLNGSTGMYLDGATARRNVVYGNGGDGVYVDHNDGPSTIQNNLIYSNSTSGTSYYNINVPSCRYCSVLVENNTLDGGNGLYLDLGGAPTDTVRNNIIWARGAGQYAFWVDNPPGGSSILTSDYNDLYATDGATLGYWHGALTTLAAWQAATLRDLNSLSVDPLFDIESNFPTNFHLQSTNGSYKGPPFTALCGTNLFTSDPTSSLCIDGGDTNSNYASECDPNGCRINLGAFGNTADASLSFDFLALTSPNGGENWFRTETITWLARGTCTNGTVTLQWTNINTHMSGFIANVNPADGRKDWDINYKQVQPGPGYEVQLIIGSVTNNSNPFTILGPERRSFYVNDASTNGDVYCCAPCAAGNDGLSCSNPMCSAQEVIDTYPLRRNDVVWIDTGNYPLSATITITTNDFGSPGQPLTFRGSTNPAGSVFIRNSSTNDGFYVAGAPYIRLENLKVKGANNGIRADNNGGPLVQGLEVLGCEVYSNSGVGILLSSNANAIVSDNLAHNNQTGLSLDGVSLVSSNVCYSNSRDGLDAATVTGPITSNVCYKNRSGLSANTVTGPITSNVCYDNNNCGFCVNVASNGFTDNLSYSNSTGISISQAFGAVTDNECHDNVAGFTVSSGSGSVSSNRCYNNNSDGLSVSGTFSVQTNECHHNSGSWGLETHVCGPVEGNAVHDNTGGGLSAYGGCTSSVQAVGNQIFLNGSMGLYLQDGGTARCNVVYRNGGDGIRVRSSAAIQNNLIYSNSTGSTNYFNINASGAPMLIENNTLDGGNGLYLNMGSAPTNTVRNNIIWARGIGRYAFWVDNPPIGASILTSDYNDLYATEGASVGYWLGNQAELADWQYFTGRDSQSFSADPLFVSGTNFHLQSIICSYKGAPFTAPSGGTFTPDDADSVCVDAGDPTSGYTKEPPDIPTNGCGRSDLGAFGNTADASCPPTNLVVELVSVKSGDVLRGTKRVTWITRGPWCPGDTVTIQTNDSILGIYPYAQGYCFWNTSASPGPGNTLSIWPTSPPEGNQFASSSLRILPYAATSFYVNDDTNMDCDVYCSAPGNNANDGLTPATPKRTLKRLLRDYMLIPGDVVWIDTGLYNLDSTLELFDSGSPTQQIQYVGSTNCDGTILDRGDVTQDLFLLAGAHDIRFENFRLTDGRRGINGYGVSTNHISGISVSSCEIYGNGYDHGDYGRAGGGILLHYCDGPVISGCEAHNNYSFDGGQITLLNCSNAVVVDSLTHDTTEQGWGIGGIVVDSTSMTVTNNECYNDEGMNLSGDGLASGNHIHHGYAVGLNVSTYNSFVVQNNESDHNGDMGIRVEDLSTGPVLVQNNIVHENSNFGLLLDNSAGNASAEAIGNRVFLNGDAGLWLWYWPAARGNVVYSNGGDGVHVGGGPTALQNNLIYDSGMGYYNINAQDSRVLIENNTLYGGDGLYLGNLVATTNRNNIIWTQGSGSVAITAGNPAGSPNSFLSDYNDFFVTNGAIVGSWGGIGCPTLANWQSASSRDANSLSTNPFFVDPNGADDWLGGYYGEDDNFHLQSTAGSWHLVAWSNDTNDSPCVDAGDPRSAFALEPVCNGLRVNMGAYGNTETASKSVCYTLTVTNLPSNGGSISMSPPGGLYPTNQPVTVTLSSSAANYFYFQDWANDISTSANPVSFVVSSNMMVEALYGAFCHTANDVCIPDWWLAQYGLPLSDAGAAADTDGDGLANWQEYLTGTDPTNSASSFRITAIAQEGNDIRVTWMTGPDKTNALQAAAGDAGGSYSNDFADMFTVTNTVSTVTNCLDPGAVTNFPSRFYRVRLVP